MPADPIPQFAALIPIPRCPLCGTSASSASAAAQPNLYSEQLAGLLGCDEQKLLATVGNRECAACGLIYKSRWLPQPLLERLFQTTVAVHPKGWDVTGDRFSVAAFVADAHAYGAALQTGDPGAIGRLRRRLSSVVDSLIEIAGSSLAQDLHAAIASGTISDLLASEARLAQLQWRPWPFKRFSGFSDAALWAWFESHLGKISRYGEIGCPLWGFLYRRPVTGVAWHYLRRDEPNYWAGACQSGGTSCVSRLQANGDLDQRDWGAAADAQLDLIGAFQYLDHVEQPLQLLSEALDRAPAVALILDAGDAPTAVQHFSGWTVRSLQYAAEQVGARLIHGFAPIRSSGNEVYLMIRGRGND